MAEKGLGTSLVLLMGLPGSGKSHLAEKIETEIKSKKNSAVAVVSYDDFVPHSVQSQFPLFSDSNLAKTCRKNYVDSVRYIVEQFKKDSVHNESRVIEKELNLTSVREDIAPVSMFVSKVKDIVDAVSLKSREEAVSELVIMVDDNNYYSSMREDFYQIAKACRTGFCVLYCKTSLQTCRKRNSERPDGVTVPDKNIIEMSLKLEPPNPMKYPCDVFSLEIPEVNEYSDADTTTLEKSVTLSIIPLVIQVIESSLKNPVDWSPPPVRAEDIEKQRRICSESEIHQADLVLRKWITKEIGLLSLCPRESGVSKASVSKEYRQRKELLLEKLRNGDLKVASDPSQDVEFQREVIELVRNLSIR